MGEFTTVGLEDVAAKFLRMEEAATKAVPLMLEAGAAVLVKAQQDEAAAMGIKETAGFIQSIKATPVKGDDTERYVEVYPQGKAKHGNDRKGDKGRVRYATIGFIAQYGTRRIKYQQWFYRPNGRGISIFCRRCSSPITWYIGT